MADQEKIVYTQEQIEQIRKEASEFEQKSIELAASSPAVSAHYWRLFQACKPSLKRFARLELTNRNKQAAEKRKNAKKGTQEAAPQPATRSGRQTA